MDANACEDAFKTGHKPCIDFQLFFSGPFFAILTFSPNFLGDFFTSLNSCCFFLLLSASGLVRRRSLLSSRLLPSDTSASSDMVTETSSEEDPAPAATAATSFLALPIFFLPLSVATALVNC